MSEIQPQIPNIAALVLAAHGQDLSRTTLCIVSTSAEARALSDDLKFLQKIHSDYLPSEYLSAPIEIYPAFYARPGTLSEFTLEISPRRNRCHYLHLFSKPSPIIITTLNALSTRCPSESYFTRYFHEIGVNDEVSLKNLSLLCKNLGYEMQDLVDEVGTFALRGFVLDIFSPAYDNPLRVEFIGEQIEKISTFNLNSQHTQEDLNSAVILSPRLFHNNEHPYLNEIEEKLKTIPISTKQKYEMIDSLREGLWWEEADLIEAACSPGFEFPEIFYKDAQSLIFDQHKCEQVYAPPIDLHHESELFPLSRSPCISSFRLKAQDVISAFSPLDLSDASVLSTTLTHPPKPYAHFPFTPETRGEFFTDWLPRWIENRGKVFFSYQSHLHLQQILKHVEKAGIDPRSLVLEAHPISNSFIDEEEKSVVIRAQDIFAGAGTLDIPDAGKIQRFFSTLSTLEEGDFVIHSQHGIARYLGLQHIEIQDVSSEYIALEFLHQDKLYIPIYRLHLIQKYKAKDIATVTVDSLRDQKFAKRKRKIQEKITRFAHELIALQAKRELTRTDAFAYVEDETDFAEHFPFDETRDQLKSIEDVLRDIEKTIPMDRLLCGDVGFGKTEVAFRAIFRALSHNKQAVVLTPTTLLAHQHYRTAVERFKKHPFVIEVISRFRTLKEQKAIIQKLKSGHIDCIIGTHRLLQKDVDFKKLGLLVIDEEQKFGVKQKEFLKKIRVQTHTLILSATPIPRSLNQSFMGLRSLSIITTPPTNRLPIHTYLTKLDHTVLVPAIEREIARDGQVFCVVPRVADIPQVEHWLSTHFPTTPYGVAHGQMPEDQLENIMIDFYEKKFPVLVSTTIIESGLDVPSANTMLVFKANMFGLSQLYQLRGRTGRSGRQAYCYLLLPFQDEIPKKAKKRLEILLRYHDLGSGFQVAQHDLEVRGAGNVLGEEQTGFISEIGAELYFDMLKSAVQRLQGKDQESIDPEIVWGWESLIPEKFLPSISLRLETYQSLSRAQDISALNALCEEIENRFGPPAPETLNLYHLHHVRLICMKLGIKHFQVRGSRLDMTFIEHPSIDMQLVLQYFEKSHYKFQFRSSHQLSITVTFKNPTEVVDFLSKFADATLKTE